MEEDRNNLADDLHMGMLEQQHNKVREFTDKLMRVKSTVNCFLDPIKGVNITIKVICKPLKCLPAHFNRAHMKKMEALLIRQPYRPTITRKTAALAALMKAHVMTKAQSRTSWEMIRIPFVTHSQKTTRSIAKALLKAGTCT